MSASPSVPDHARLHVIVEGYVQGVGFRAFVYKTAVALQLTGWVRNRWDGSVEVLAEGTVPILGQLLTSLHSGPRNAYVTGVAPEWLPFTGEFDRFDVHTTE